MHDTTLHAPLDTSRQGTKPSKEGADGGDPTTLHEDALAYVDHDDVAGSPLVTKPSGRLHGGGTVPGFDSSGNALADRTAYKALVRWIDEGAAND